MGGEIFGNGWPYNMQETGAEEYTMSRTMPIFVVALIYRTNNALVSILGPFLLRIKSL